MLETSGHQKYGIYHKTFQNLDGQSNLQSWSFKKNGRRGW